MFLIVLCLQGSVFDATSRSSGDTFNMHEERVEIGDMSNKLTLDHVVTDLTTQA